MRGEGKRGGARLNWVHSDCTRVRPHGHLRPPMRQERCERLKKFRANTIHIPCVSPQRRQRGGAAQTEARQTGVDEQKKGTDWTEARRERCGARKGPEVVDDVHVQAHGPHGSAGEDCERFEVDCAC